MKHFLVSMVMLGFASTQLHAADAFANIHSVAVISLLGDDILLHQTADFTGDDLAPIVAFDTKMGIDQYVKQRIADAVSSRFSIVNAAMDPALLKNDPIPPAMLDDLQARFLKEPKTSVHAFIVVHPIIRETQSALRVLVYRETGMSLSHTELYRGSATVLDFTYRVSVFDSKTGKKIDYGTASLVTPNIFHGPFAMESCNNKIWPDDPSHPRDEVAKQIRADVMAAISQSLAIALKSAGLANESSNGPVTSWDGVDTVCKSVF